MSANDTKRLRMFAGPNGSGKSTIIKSLKKKFDFGIYLNADEIEVILKRKNEIKLSDYMVESTGFQFQEFIEKHSLAEKVKANGSNLTFKNNIIKGNSSVSLSYEASIIVDFIRQRLFEMGKKVSFETVMSHISKIDILRKTKKMGYKNYLYFVATEDVEINKSRVMVRVNEGGHNVPTEKIESRYYKSLEHLRNAVRYSYRAFIFDNSGDTARLILDVYNGNEVTIRDSEIPLWVNTYLLS